MRPFAEILDRAAQRKGGIDAVKALLPDCIKSKNKLAELDDNRYLSGMTMAIFKAGFVWKIVASKWSGFEEAFWGFDIGRCAALSPDEEDALCLDTRIIRNRQKILTVPHNAVMILEAARQHGSFGRFIADWPSEDFIGLLDYFGQHGSRLGGMTAQYFLHFIGRDGFVLGRDGVFALIEAGIIAKKPTGKADRQKVQQAYNQWQAESGFGQAEISRILALSIDAPKES